MDLDDGDGAGGGGGVGRRAGGAGPGRPEGEVAEEAVLGGEARADADVAHWAGAVGDDSSEPRGAGPVVLSFLLLLLRRPPRRHAHGTAAAERGAFRRAIGGGEWVVAVVVWRKGDWRRLGEERNEELKMACRGDEETGETEWLLKSL